MSESISLTFIFVEDGVFLLQSSHPERAASPLFVASDCLFAAYSVRKVR